MCEISLSFDGFNEYDRYEGEPSPNSFAMNFHEDIFSQIEAPCAKKMICRSANELSAIGCKTNALFLREKMKPSAVRGGGAIEIDISWGGPDGVEMSFAGKGELHDDNGNFIDIKAEQNSDGTGNVKISAGHKEE